MFLEININFGDNYFEGEGAERMFPIILMFMTVFFTQFVVFLYDNWKQNKKLDSLFNHFKRQIELLNKSAVLYAEGLSEIGSQLAKKEIGNINIKLNNDFDLDLVGDWTSPDFIESILNRRKGKEVTLFDLATKIKNKLNNYKRNKELFSKELQEFRIKYQMFQDRFNDNIAAYQDYFNYLNNTPQPDKEVVKDVLSVMNNWKAKGMNTEKNYVYETIVLPVIEICNNYKGDERAHILQSTLYKCKAAFTDLDNLRKFYSQWFSNAANILLDNKKELEVNMTAVSNLPRKKL